MAKRLNTDWDRTTTPLDRQPVARYVALTQLWHSRDLVYVEAGQSFDASHLTPDELKTLLDLQAIGPNQGE